MDRMSVLNCCRELAKADVWCIRESVLSAALGYPNQASLRVALSRHVKSGLIQRVATKLYLNPFLHPPAFALYKVANYLRPEDDFYLSLEAVLSESSRISQIPTCLTFVTNGNGHVYSTLLGDIHFIKTKESPEKWKGHLTYNQKRGVWEASEEKALADLVRYGKNLHMVDEQDER